MQFVSDHCLDSFSPVHRKLRAATALTADDEAAIRELLSDQVEINPGTTLLDSGKVSGHAYAILSGWGYRFRMFEDGRRQIFRLFLPGDFLGFNSGFLGVPDHSIASMTHMTVARFDPQVLAHYLKTSPRLSFALLWSTTRDRMILEERIASVGRRSSYERLAHILMELYLRLELVGQAERDAFVLPLTQEHLADLLGLTSIHVNRILRKLRQDGLISVAKRKIKIESRDRLMRVADFDARYLIHSCPALSPAGTLSLPSLEGGIAP